MSAATLPQEKLNALVNRLSVIEAEMAHNPDPEKYVALSQEYAELDPVVAQIRALKAAEAEHADLEEMLDDPADGCGYARHGPGGRALAWRAA